jgi:hypothetical protein
MPRSPVSHFAQGSCGGRLIAFIDCCSVGRIETPERRLNRPQTFGRYEVTVTGHRAIRK